jgi:glycosyltransferase involved in cell wall biosynthesis
LGIPADARVVGFVSRIDPFKGHSDALRAFAQTVALQENAFMLIVGDGQLRPDVETEAMRLGLTNRILFTGFRSDVPKLLSVMDVFIHPSSSDACPLAVLEASAAAIPVVAYMDGGIPEIVISGVTGLLTPSGTVDQLSSALAALLRDRDRSNSMGRAGRDRMAQEFQPISAGARFANILTDVAGQTRTE